MTNVPFDEHRRLPRHRGAQPPRGGRRRRACPVCAAWAATTRARRCSGTRREHAGFTTGEPWIAVNPNHTEINAEAAVADPDSVFHHYRRLIEFRHEEPAVAEGDFTMLLQDDERIYAFTRRLGDTELLVTANFSADTVTPELPAEWAEAEVAIGDPGDGLSLGPWEARVYRR